MKHLISSFTGLVLGALLVWFMLPGEPLGQGTRDTLRGNSNAYTNHEASSTASRALTSDTSRIGLEVLNEKDGNNVRIYLQATSTSVTATSGIQLAPGSSYTPEFNWVGEIWAITESGTSTLLIQSTK